ncbi:hypothetical protein [Chengkuizengella sediminis]|uniref:hypothetical protein n=1 Tax=Chengkuizengella sediminis TaxID=1885917 RepID=UPI00138963AC|nr:hypothetical protein [Chengkuizengella sediminis]
MNRSTPINSGLFNKKEKLFYVYIFNFQVADESKELYNIIVFTVLFLSLLFSLPINAETKVDLQSNSEYYYDEERGAYLTSVYEVTDDGLKEMSIDNYLKLKDENKKVENQIQK